MANAKTADIQAQDLDDISEPLVAKLTARVKTFHDLAKFVDLRVQFFIGQCIQRIVFAPMTSSTKHLGTRRPDKICKRKDPFPIARPLVTDQTDGIPV